MTEKLRRPVKYPNKFHPMRKLNRLLKNKPKLRSNNLRIPQKMSKNKKQPPQKPNSKSLDKRKKKFQVLLPKIKDSLLLKPKNQGRSSQWKRRNPRSS